MKAKDQATTNPGGLEVPNLDGLDVADLRRLEAVFGLLACYAGHKADGGSYRLAGDIEAALAAERCAESAFRKLPTWARW